MNLFTFYLNIENAQIPARKHLEIIKEQYQC